jgi:hypothetical protein
MRDYGLTNAAPYASAPAVGAAGATYFNTTSKTLWLSDGTTWIATGVPSADYFYGHLISPASIPGTFAAMGWTTDLANNITLPSAPNVTFANAGKYRVAAQISAQTSGAGGTALTTRITLFAAGGATKFARDTVNPLSGTSGVWATAFAEAIFDVAATDYVQVLVVGSGATSIPDPRSWIEITPVGGAKGDTGATGATGTPGTPGVDEHAPLWLPLTLNANWTNYGPNFQTARVTRKHGIVMVEGLIVAAAGAGGTATTLPLGYRPGAGLIYLQHSAAATATAARSDIQADGTITSGPIPTAYASIVASFVADPAFGIEYGFDAPTVAVVNATTISVSLPAGVQWENGVRVARPLLSAPSLPLGVNQWLYVNTLGIGSNQASLATALSLARTSGRTTTSIPAWIVQRDAASNFILTDIREWF